MGYLLDSDTESEDMSFSSMDDSNQDYKLSRQLLRADFNANITQGDNEARLSGLLSLKAALGVPDNVSTTKEEEAESPKKTQGRRALPTHTKSCDDALTSMAKARRSSALQQPEQVEEAEANNNNNNNADSPPESFQDFLAQEQSKVGDLMERIRQKREQAQEERRLSASKNRKKPSRSSSTVSKESNRGEELNQEEMSELQRLKALKEKKRLKKQKSATPKRALPGRTKSCDDKLTGASTTPIHRRAKKPPRAITVVAPSAA